MKSNMTKINADKINKVEIHMAEIKTDLTYIKKGQTEMSDKLDSFIEEIHKQREIDRNDNDKRYASKDYEKALNWIIRIAAAIIITAIIRLVLI